MAAANCCKRVRNLTVYAVNGSQSSRHLIQLAARDHLPVRFPIAELNPRPQTCNFTPVLNAAANTTHWRAATPFLVVGLHLRHAWFPYVFRMKKIDDDQALRLLWPDFPATPTSSEPDLLFIVRVPTRPKTPVASQ